jgi:SOS response regulatory protein OraA/RecX
MAEQNSLGLTAKLQRRGYGAAVAKAVVFRLLDCNLLDDERYAELWIRSRLALRKTSSPQRLLIALGKRGIDRNSSGKALKRVLDPETEYALLLKYLETSAGSDHPEEVSSYELRFPENKRGFSLRSHLKYEGFSSIALDRYFNEK